MERQDLEEWKPIRGFTGYEVSNFGRVRSFQKRGSCKIIPEKPRVLAERLKSNGYVALCLMNKKTRKYLHVHRLVMEAFVGKSPLTVNHKDGNKLNNHLSNLEYATRKQNSIHARKAGLFKKTITGKDFLTPDEVRAIRMFHHRSIAGIMAKIFDRGLANIWAIKNRRLYKWVK